MKSTSHLGTAETLKNKIEKAFCKNTSQTTVPKTGEKLLSQKNSNKTGLCSSMIHNVLLLLLLTLTITILIMPTAIAVPEIFNVQGRLTDDNNVVVTGSYNFLFHIYDSDTGV